MKFDSKKLPVITTILIAVVMIITLFVLRIGVADNGNLGYTLENIGVYDFQSAAGSGYYADSFGVSSKNIGDGSGGLVYGIIKLFFPVDSVLYVYIPAIVYMLVFLLGIYLYLKNMLSDNKVTNILMCVLAAIMIADAGYIAFFNTPYTEGAFISYLTLFLGAYAASAKTLKKRYLVLAGISGALFGATGIYASLTGVMISLAMLSFVKSKDAGKRVVSVIAAALVLVSSLYGFTVEKAGNNMKYNRVFYGILSFSQDSGQALTDLGLDKNLTEYANIPVFEEKAQSFISSDRFNEIREKTDTISIVKYYFSHTDEFSKALKASVNNSTRIKSSYLGDYPAYSGKAGQQSNFWTLYSSIKHRIIPASLPILLIFVAAVILLSLSYKSKNKEKTGTGNMVQLMIALAIGAILTLPVAIFQNGLSLIDFNMRSYNFIFDVTLFGAITGGVNMMLSRQQELREKYGVNQ